MGIAHEAAGSSKERSILFQVRSETDKCHRENEFEVGGQTEASQKSLKDRIWGFSFFMRPALQRNMD